MLLVLILHLLYVLFLKVHVHFLQFFLLRDLWFKEWSHLNVFLSPQQFILEVLLFGFLIPSNALVDVVTFSFFAKFFVFWSLNYITHLVHNFLDLLITLFDLLLSFTISSFSSLHLLLNQTSILLLYLFQLKHSLFLLCLIFCDNLACLFTLLFSFKFLLALFIRDVLLELHDLFTLHFLGLNEISLFLFGSFSDHLVPHTLGFHNFLLKLFFFFVFCLSIKSISFYYRPVKIFFLLLKSLLDKSLLLDLLIECLLH